MNYQELLIHLSMFLGITAGLYFCLGSATLTKMKIEEMATARFESNEGFKIFLIALKAEYASGGFILVLSFLCQFIGNTKLSLNWLKNTFVQNYSCGLVLSILITAFFAISMYVYRNFKIKEYKIALEHV